VRPFGAQEETTARRSETRLTAVARRRGARGLTLIELMVTMAIIAVMAGMVYAGSNSLDGTRLKGSAMMIASAVHVAYAHANSSSKMVRLVFDFDQRTVMLEESSSKLALAKNDVTGGAAAATEAERKAQEETAGFAQGVKPARPTFMPTKAFGFGNKASPGKPLESGIRFFQVETAHDDKAEKMGRSYLYFWPGGLTERAAIQLLKGGATDQPREEDVLTIIISPLTGKTQVKRGRFAMPRPRDEIEESERIDTAVF
jgi:general secretion pathway protein H